MIEASTPIASLNAVLAQLSLAPLAQDSKVKHLSLDSRTIEQGDIFIALAGSTMDGRQFITKALQQGAAAVLAEKHSSIAADNIDEALLQHPNVFWVQDLRNQLAGLADWFYGSPSKKVAVMGVTGTNGKTSCCWLLAQLSNALKQPCAMMGTIGIGLPSQLQGAQNTTADIVSTQRYLAQLAAQGIHRVAIEVSSHGLEQKRTQGLRFDSSVFTHLSRDHLDYHGSMDNYAQVKSKLFSEHSYQHAILGLDDAYYGMMRQACGDHLSVVTWSVDNPTANVYLSDIHALPNGFSAYLHTPWGEGEFKTKLLGRFNLANLLAVIATLGAQGHAIADLLPLLPQLNAPVGRMQLFGGGPKPTVLVDYAHTPDAITSVLQAIQTHKASRVICLYGCGGDRDRGKRPLMTQAALNGADVVILTSDNSRTESPQQIFADALAEVSENDHRRMTLIPDRGQAIAETIAAAAVDDIILIAGRGHETHLDIGGEKILFVDSEYAIASLEQYNTN